MIAFRHADPRFPFLWEDSSQPAGRWNEAGRLTHYFTDTPDGAWAEFLRHEEIVDPADLQTVRRALWVVEIGDEPAVRPELAPESLTGGWESWSACQEEADRLRSSGASGLTAPSAALRSGGAHGWRVDGGFQSGPARDGKVFALFGSCPDLVGWPATVAGRPGEDLLGRVRHFGEAELEERHRAGYRKAPPTKQEFIIPERDHARGDDRGEDE